MTRARRTPPQDRRALLLAAAVSVSAREGYNRVTREAIAQAGAVSPALVSHTFGTIQALRRAIMGEAIRLARAGGADADAAYAAADAADVNTADAAYAAADAVAASHRNALAIVAQGLAAGDPRTKGLPDSIRQCAVASLAG